MKLPIGLELYSVRTDLEADFEGTLKKLKAFGYDGVEFAGLYGNSPEKIANLLGEIGLAPAGAHVGIAEMRADMKKVVADYKAIGCKDIAVPWLGEDDRPGGKNYENTVKDIRKFAEMAADAGITMSYHNHDFEFVKDENGVYGFDKLYEDIPENLLKTEQDTCWVAVAGENPAKYLKKYKGRCPLVHLKDYFGEKTEGMYGLIGGGLPRDNLTGFEYRPLGKGVQDIKSICEAAIEAETCWFIVEQDEPSMGLSRMECAEISINYLKSLGY